MLFRSLHPGPAFEVDVRDERLEVAAEAVFPEPRHVDDAEHDHRERPGHVNVRGGRRQERDHPEQVAEEHEQEQRAEKRQVFVAIFVGLVAEFTSLSALIANHIIMVTLKPENTTWK